MANRAPEIELTEKLKADTTLTAHIKAVYSEKVPRTPKMPYIILNMIGDDEEKALLSRWGGSAAIQIDIYSRDETDYALRSYVKDAVRRVRGISGGLKFTVVRVTGEQSFGMEETGLHRWVVDVKADYTEE